MRQKRGIFHPGTSLLVVVFVVLCLVTLGLLSYKNGDTDRKQSQNSFHRVSVYYEADTEAKVLLASLDSYLSELFWAESKEDYLSDCGKIAEKFPFLTEAGDNSYFFDVKAGESQLLRVTFFVAYPEKGEDTFCHILQWSLIPSREWIPEETLHLYDGTAD